MAGIDWAYIAYNIVVAAAAAAVTQALTPTQRLRGPRLDDLKVQTSSYGTYIPEISGSALRVKGDILWFEGNEIQEVAHTETEGGKGGGPSIQTTTYSYLGSFAAAICEGEIVGIRKIWADSVLIYDVSSSANTETLAASLDLYKSLRIYSGTATQDVDSIIEADQADTPAYRGLAYQRVEDLLLEKFGNRIPNMTYEVVNNGSLGAPNVIETLSDSALDSVVWRQQYIDDGVCYWVKSEASLSAGTQITVERKRTTITGGLIKNNNFTITNSGASALGYDTPVINSRKLHFYNSTYNGNNIEWMYDSIKNLSYIVEGKTDTLRNIANSGGQTCSIRAAFEYNSPLVGQIIYGITGGGDGGSEDSSYVLGWDSEGGEAAYEYDVGGAALVSLFANENGVYVLESETLSLLSHDLAALLNSWSSASLANPNRRSIIRLVDNRLGVTFGSSVKAFDLGADGSITLVGSLSGTTEEHQPAEISPGLFYYGLKTIYYIDQIVLTPEPLEDVVVGICERGGISSSDIDASDLTDTVDGYVISRLMTVAEALEPLQVAYHFDIVESEYKLKFIKRGGGSAVSLIENDLAAHEYGQQRPEPLAESRKEERRLPVRIDITHFDRDREYDNGQEYASRLITTSKEVESIDLPIVLSPQSAADIAQTRLYNLWEERYSYDFQLPWKYLYLDPADVIDITLDGTNYNLRIIETNAGKPGIIECKAVGERSDIYTSSAQGVGGPSTTNAVNFVGATNFVFLDIPILRDIDDYSGYYIGGGGYYSGWESATLFASRDGGESYNPITGIITAATIGQATDALGDADFDFIDRVNTVNIRLITPGKTLESVSELSMLNGSNLAAIGADGRWEIIKYQNAALEGDGTYTLSTLVRGYRGTEHNTGNHTSSDDFILLTQSTLQRISSAASTIGASAAYKPVSTGSTVTGTTEYTHTYNGVGLKPYAPTHVRGTRDGSGNLTATWFKRTRLNGEWRDSVDITLGEDSEAYEVDILSGGSPEIIRTITGLSSATASYTAAQQTTDFGGTQSSVTVRIYQISATIGRGYMAEVTL